MMTILSELLQSPRIVVCALLMLICIWLLAASLKERKDQ